MINAELREASSRQTLRFLEVLVSQWSRVSASFRDRIMEGIAYHLAYLYGNLRPDNTWFAIEKPDAATLANQILDELERHSDHWQHNRYAAEALKACANVIQDKQNASRLELLARGFENLKEKSTVKSNSYDYSDNLLIAGINMTSGKVTEALMILVNNCQERGIEFPELLPSTLRQFASHENPKIRVLILRSTLVYFVGHFPTVLIIHPRGQHFYFTDLGDDREE